MIKICDCDTVWYNYNDVPVFLHVLADFGVELAS